ncbi:hypothetical protein [Roseibium suaedae]|uniref:Uncharacterized protein n=1 Tax=Roseibium suaedae TaxID=735517 RepID=A0A1M7D1W7_9HYPH|nr:hypothetical protein [Roseibium suaedae]SHL73486.1 hypothetical protein SAMN05444272_1344 [Roseibium suaedae]
MKEEEFLRVLDEALENLQPRELQIVAKNASEKVIHSVFGFEYEFDGTELSDSFAFSGSEREISRKKLLLSTLSEFLDVSGELREEHFYGFIEGIYLVWECLTELGFDDQKSILTMTNFLDEARRVELSRCVSI